MIFLIRNSHFDLYYLYSNTNNVVEHISKRPIYEFNGEYYRVTEMCFKKPFVVIEGGTYDELIKNIMEDANSFPYNLSDAELLNEVKYALEMEP